MCAPWRQLVLKRLWMHHHGDKKLMLLDNAHLVFAFPNID